MYCKKCGKFLAGNENFCSNCGAKIEVPEVTDDEKMFETDKKEKSTDNIKVMSPVDEMVWDLKEFPSSKPRKTEDANIRWRSDDMFLHKEIVKQNEEAMPSVTENEELKEELKKDKEAEAAKAAKEAEEAKAAEEARIEQEAEEKKKTLDRLEIPNMFKDHSYSMPGAQNDLPKKRESVVTRNTAPIDFTGFKSDNVVEIEQPTGGIAFEVTDSGVERLRADEPEMTSAIVEDIKEPKHVEIEKDIKKDAEVFKPADVSETSSELAVHDKAPKEEVRPSRPEPKKSLFDEIAPKAVETLEGAAINKEKKKIDKFYTFNRKKEEFQKLLDKEYERIERKCDIGGFEDDISSFMDVKTGRVVEGTTQLEEMVKARELFFDDPYYVPKEELEQIQAEKFKAMETEKEAKKEVAEPVAKEAVTKQIVEEPTEVGLETIKEEPAKYETAFEEPTEETIEEPVDKPVEELAELEEDEPEVAKVVFEPENDEPLSVSLKKKAQQQKEEKEKAEAEVANAEKLTDDDSKLTSDAGVLTSDAETDEEKSEDEEDKEPEIARVIIDPTKKEETTQELAREFFDEDDEKYKRGKGTKVAIWILSIIIVVVAALLVIRIAFPNTAVSSYMDKVADTVISKFTSDDKSKEASNDDSVREGLVEDKSGLIQLEIDNNYKNNIANIKYNKSAKYDSNKSYSIANLKDAKEIQTNVWYQDEDGTTYYYDQEIVGAIIAFESQKVALINDNDQKIYDIVVAGSNISQELKKEVDSKSKITNFETLEIGDIKVAGNAYYVWVIETIDAKSTPKVYEIKETDNKLQVSDVSEA